MIDSSPDVRHHGDSIGDTREGYYYMKRENTDLEEEILPKEKVTFSPESIPANSSSRPTFVKTATPFFLIDRTPSYLQSD